MFYPESLGVLVGETPDRPHCSASQCWEVGAHLSHPQAPAQTLGLQAGFRSQVSTHPWESHSTPPSLPSLICMGTFPLKKKIFFFFFFSVQSLSRVLLFATPWTAAHQASLSIINSRSPAKPMSTESVMPSNHLILCCPLLLLPSVFPFNLFFFFLNKTQIHKGTRCKHISA